MKSHKLLFLFVVTLLLNTNGRYAVADEGLTGLRDIVSLGCHKTGGTCYIQINGVPVGAPACVGNSIRWSVMNNDNGKTWLALFTTALALKKKVNLNITGCYVNEPIVPTFSYGTIEGG
ncbi:MAG: hypothetical protein V3U84_04570 [Thiotrichaceae bacterium]